MESSGAFCNQLLIAMPGLNDPQFHATVTLVCEHNADGALGIVINRPLSMALGELLAQLSLTATDQKTANSQIYSGGPVAVDRGFVLHNSAVEFESSLSVSDDIKLTFSRDVLDAMAAGKGPDKTLVALGYAGWAAGQLEQEMLANSWLSVPASPEIVFDLAYQDRWHAAARSLGIDMSRLSPDAGHA
ncbi:MAG: YqgE/AlgH family protein [Woeseia sp.]